MTFVEPDRRLANADDNDSFIYYVPILDTLKTLLSHEDVLADVMDDKRSTDGYIRDYQDSDHFKNHELFKQHPTALRVELYYDDFTVTNAIGKSTRNYKISAVYFKLGNLSLKYKSNSDFIQLVSLCIHRLVVKPYGIDSMLSPLINDIKILETNGIQVNFDGNQHHFLEP